MRYNVRRRSESLQGQFSAYDEMLRKNGQMVGGEALQSAQGGAVTLRFQKGKVTVTDGPHAETKDSWAAGFFFILEARDIKQAIRLMSKNPAVKGGRIEIRPVAD